MGHEVNVVSFDYDNGSQKMKDKISAILDQQAEYYSDSHTGLPYHIEWTSKKFNNFDDAADWLMHHEGNYWQGAAMFKVFEKTENSKSVKLQKKVDALEDKQKKVLGDLKNFVSKSDVKNRKSVYVGCPKCGSKLHKDYIPIQWAAYEQDCPLCHTDLFSDTVKTRIQNYRKQVSDLNKQIRDAKRDAESVKYTGKFKWKWAVKYEFHC